MNHKYVIAIVRPEVVPILETKLRSIGVGGITLTKVRGFGEYKNFFTNDLLTDYTKVELFTESSRVQAVLDALVELSHADIPGSGVVAVVPAERFLHLRTGTETLPDAAV